MLVHYDSLSEKARQRAFERVFPLKPRPKEFASITSYPKKRERQRAFALWLFDKEFDLFMTINSNDPFSGYAQSRAALKKLDALLDHYFLGRKWWSYASKRRTYFVAIPEHGGGELHYHVLVRIPTNARPERRSLPHLRAFLRRTLQSQRIFKRGDVQVQPLSGFIFGSPFAPSAARKSWLLRNRILPTQLTH